jgi:hypothetical protein
MRGELVTGSGKSPPLGSRISLRLKSEDADQIAKQLKADGFNVIYVG